MSEVNLTVGQLTRETSALRPTDSVGRAAEALRHSVYSALPVVEDGRVVGLVTEADLRRAFPIIAVSGSNGDGRSSPTVASLMRTDVPPVPESVPLGALADLLEQYPLDALPVIDAFGHFRGMVSRVDVIAAQCQTIRPPLIGGMATPMGVYLMAGSLRAGASNLALFLTGAFMGSLTVITQILILAVCRWIDLQWGTSYRELYFREQVIFGDPWSPTWGVEVVFTLCSTLLFLLFIRLSPLAGYHAAEHQVVHTIERAEPLVPEIVRQMPRPHPRCGTNLVVALLMLYISLGHLPRLFAVVGVLLTILNWRTIGGWIQQHFTTKPASDKQLRSGIRAGEELLRKYREHPQWRSSFTQRVMNMGLPQVLAGALASVYLWEFILDSIQNWSVGR